MTESDYIKSKQRSQDASVDACAILIALFFVLLIGSSIFAVFS